MTYWAREHEHNLRRIGDMLREIDYAYEDIIPTLVGDLRDDDKLGTQTSVDHLIAARRLLVEAQGELEKARDSLPQPQFRSQTTHPTAAEVMERDA